MFTQTRSLNLVVKFLTWLTRAETDFNLFLVVEVNQDLVLQKLGPLMVRVGLTLTFGHVFVKNDRF